VITRLVQQKRPRRSALLVAGGALAAAGLLATAVLAVWLTDSGTVDVQVADKTTSVVDATTDEGAFISYFGDGDTTFGSSGTGTFNPFVRLQASPTEQGYNTNGTTEFDTKVGKWTHAIKVSEIPQRPCPQLAPTLLCFELFVDINEGNNAKHVSLNEVEVWFTDNANLSGFPFTQTATTTQQYKFSGDILINDVNQGSGRGDLRYDIPINGPSPITLPANCNYGNPLCATYFVLYSQWGTTANIGSISYNSEGGFEEWKVKVYPVPPDISVAKTPDAGSINAGQDAVFTIVVTNNGPVTAPNVTLSDQLPAGTWTLGGTDAGACSVSATNLLTCNFGSIAYPGSRTITLTSPTTPADCGTLNNTVTVSADGDVSPANNTDTGSITINCAAIQILKESTKTGNPLVAVAGAVFSITGPGGYSASVTDNGTDDEDSTVGKVCISGLVPGTYTVNETTAPSGYGGASQSDVSATAANGTNCGANKPSTANSAVFTNAPLGEIEILFSDLGSGETGASIVCTGLTPVDENGDADPAFDDTDETYTNLVPDTYNCQIVVDP
jgi:uncharacterized repeat protein (TIGR01451 family)